MYSDEYYLNQLSYFLVFIPIFARKYTIMITEELQKTLSGIYGSSRREYNRITFFRLQSPLFPVGGGANIDRSLWNLYR